MTKPEKSRKKTRKDQPAAKSADSGDEGFLADKISGTMAKRRFKTVDPEMMEEELISSASEDDDQGRLAHLQNVKLSRKRRFFTEEDELGSGKYQGKKVSREQVFANQDDFLDHLERELEHSASELSESDYKEQEEEEETDGESLEVPLNEDAEGEDLAAELRALTAERQQALQLMQSGQSNEEGDRRKGEQVRNQIKLWDLTCEWRMNLQPLIQAANRLPRGMAVLEVPSELTAAAERVLGLSLRLSQHLAQHDGISKRISVEKDSAWRRLCKLDACLDPWLAAELEHWHKRANPLLMGNKGVTLRAINQGPHHQVTRALQADSDRILRKYRQYRHPHSKPLGDEHYDDLDFYNHLLRDWLDRHQAQAIGNASLAHLVSQIQRGKTASAAGATGEHEKASKGRKLRFDVQEKLVNYMVPAGRGPEDWTDDRMDELFRSLLQ